jgi:hypothetical protein
MIWCNIRKRRHGVVSVPDLGGSAARQRREEKQQQPDAPEILEVETAFLMYRTKDGKVILTEDLNSPVKTERQIIPEEMLTMMYIASESIKSQQTAQMTADLIMTRNMQIAQQLQAQQQFSRLGDLRS